MGELQRIERGAIGLLDEQRGGALQIRNIIKEDALRAFTLPGDARAQQLRHHVVQHRVVKTLTERVIKAYTQPLVRLVEFLAGKFNECLPDGPVIGVALL